jgi:cytochrome c oxidase assembly factor CtaG
MGCLGLLILFSFWTKFRPVWNSFLFFSGVILLFVSLSSPLDALSDEYLFSDHMLQHFLLLMIVPPLLILGMPKDATERLLEIKWIGKSEHRLNRPIVVWIVANLILWIWHIPSLYDWAVRSEGVHIFEHLTFLISATVFWWPVLAPIEKSRLSLPASMLYLFLAALSNMSLGIILTFADQAIYQPYFSPEDSWKILSVLRNEFHLNPLADQKMGGALMWVFGGVVFLAVILVQLGRWYQVEELQDLNAMEQV